MSLLFTTLILTLIAALVFLLWPLWKSGAKKQSILVAFFISITSLGIYAYVGSPRIIPAIAAHQKRAEELRKQIETYSALIKTEPENLEAWLFLGQALYDSANYAAAANSFRQAVLLSKGSPRIIMAYAEAKIMNDKGIVTMASKKSIDIALMIEPTLPLARYYQAIWLLQEGKQAEAMAKMKALYAELPDDSSLKKRINAQIGR